MPEHSGEHRNRAIDEILRKELLAVPRDFADRVMKRVFELPLPALEGKTRRRQELIEWLAVGGAVVAGMSQLIAFIFGIWTVTVAA
jgi:hypothetical protein